MRALVLIDSQAGLEDPAVAPGYEQMHQAWLEHGPGPVQEVVASIILGPGQWDGWYAKWNEQYAQWAPDDLGQAAPNLPMHAHLLRGSHDERRAETRSSESDSRSFVKARRSGKRVER